MFEIVFSVVVLLLLLSIFSNFVMRIRLTMASADKWVWWRIGTEEVADAYGARFPESPLPRLMDLVFWLVLVISVVILATVLVRSH